jgi:hypothetical protein
LVELFDPKQPFYQTYGFAKVPASNSKPAASSSSSSYSNSISAEHTKFVNELDVASCLDYHHEGVWEVAIVEGLSEFRTEIEINLPERTYETCNMIFNRIRFRPRRYETLSHLTTELTSYILSVWITVCLSVMQRISVVEVKRLMWENDFEV